VRIAGIRRAKPEGKGTDFYANICETLRHGKATYTRGMNTRRREGIPLLVKDEIERKGSVLDGTSCAEFHRIGSH